jgi:hypothetical protein
LEKLKSDTDKECWEVDPECNKDHIWCIRNNDGRITDCPEPVDYLRNLKALMITPAMTLRHPRSPNKQRITPKSHCCESPATHDTTNNAATKNNTDKASKKDGNENSNTDMLNVNDSKDTGTEFNPDENNKPKGTHFHSAITYVEAVDKCHNSFNALQVYCIRDIFMTDSTSTTDSSSKDTNKAVT